jgi:hypothetical protein
LHCRQRQSRIDAIAKRNSAAGSEAGIATYILPRWYNCYGKLLDRARDVIDAS